ncbi:pseudouridine synthase [Lipomyces japonicus]|uniref:pseudouridine synthase n=1 Tax=Lipomyces japonicus TaxID=56871 RepID=UPI0034CFAD16
MSVRNEVSPDTLNKPNEVNNEPEVSEEQISNRKRKGRTGRGDQNSKVRRTEGDDRRTKKQMDLKVPIGDEENLDGERRPKRKVACLIGYCGTGYHGMQINPPHKTIEGDIFTALVQAGAISRDNSNDPKKSGFMRAARTDSGVHAAGNVISLKMIIEDENIVEKINKNLPPTIRLWGYTRTTKGFECRKQCDSRVYEYLIPSYAFIAPKPTSNLYRRMKESSDAFPNVVLEDKESEKYWNEVFDLCREAGVDAETLADDIIQTGVDFSAKKKNGEVKSEETVQYTREQYAAIKKVKQIEYDARKAYRISKERLDRVREALKVYEGHHNFHNFTIGKEYNDPSAKRFMKSLTASEPKFIEGTEWVSIKIHGQSFMLHQIRKMISMATLVVRTGIPLTRIDEAFRRRKINIPKAPALGLLLESPSYEAINVRLNSYGHDGIHFDKYADKMEEFKKKHIYDKIYAEEEKENVFSSFFGFIDNLASGPEDQTFAYLLAAGLPGTADSASTFISTTDTALQQIEKEELSNLEGDNEG